jgi:hypothetical protein
VNQLFAKELRHFQDTTYEFKFPLDMHHDSSVFNITYRDKGNLSKYLNNTITVIYQRKFVGRDDNYLIVESDIVDLLTDFSAAEVSCKENTNLNCISNEAIAEIYN